MAAFPARDARPPLRELPGLLRLAIRVAASRLGGPSTAATMCVVVSPEGLVAFVKASYRNDWSMPGGYAESGEDPAAACAREVREETGLLLSTPPRLLATRQFSYRRDHFFIALADPAERLRPTTGWEIADFMWSTWENRPPLDDACRYLSGALDSGVESAIATELATVANRIRPYPECDTIGP